MEARGDTKEMMDRTVDLVPLMAQTARGDRTAFEQLYAGSAPRLYALCLKMLGNSEEAQDVLQDIFIKIWHHADEYHIGRGAPLTWMMSIGRYACLDLLRGRRGHQDVDDLSDELSGNEPDPQQSALGLADRRQLDRCMGELSDQQRASIQMAYFHGFSHHELAANLEIPLGTVKSWLRRGMEFLRRCLER